MWIIQNLPPLIQAQNCLTSLYKLDKVQFRQTMREYVNKDSLNNIVDFLHALLGFCMEPITDSKYVAQAGPGAHCDTAEICWCALTASPPPQKKSDLTWFSFGAIAR